MRKRGIVIGKNTYISPKAYIDTHRDSKVIIGNNCFITRQVIILNHTDVYMGGPEQKWSKYGGKRISKDVKIGNNVFIGVSSTVLPGVSIGDNVIIGANSVINADIPSNKVCAGAPIRILKDIEEFLRANDDFDLEGWKKDNSK